MASCRDDGFDAVSTACRSSRRIKRAVEPTAKCRNNTVTEISERLVDQFLAMPCQTGSSMTLVIGPKKSFQATIVPLEEEDIEERWGPTVKQQLYREQKAREEQEKRMIGRLLVEQKQVKDAIPRNPAQLSSRSSSGSRVSVETSQKTGETTSRRSTTSMVSSLWSFGSSTSF